MDNENVTNENCFCAEHATEQSSEDAAGFRGQKHEAIIGNLESKIKEQSVIIEKKDFELQSTEGLLAETEAKISELNSKLIGQSKQFEQGHHRHQSCP